jgi:predicted RNase H-like nuclease
MRFIGIDFGWQGKPTGLASLDLRGRTLRLRSMLRLKEVPKILAWVDAEAAAGPAGIGIDAPIVIPNATGMREVDKLMHRHFGRYHAGCYPANLARPFAQRTVALSRALEERGFGHGDALTRRADVRFQIEVHPHAACVQLFDLPQIVKYKKGTLAERRAELGRYREMLLTRLPLLDELELPPIPQNGPALKELEDQMDAVLCAYIAAHWWMYGTARNAVFGTAADGYIVVPARASASV